MLSTSTYITTFGVAETWQLKPVIEQNGDIINTSLDLSVQPWLVNAVKQANEFVGLYLSDEVLPALFDRYAAQVARHYLHFGSHTDESNDSFKLLVKQLESFGGITGSNVKCETRFRVSKKC